MADIANLISKRAIIKDQITRFKTFLSKVDVTDNFEIECPLQKIDDVWKEFNMIQTDIKLLSVNEPRNEEERELFQNTYFEVISEAQKKLNWSNSSKLINNVPQPVNSGSKSELVK